MLVYIIVKCMAKRGIHLVAKVKDVLEKKLFYNSFYRYMIVSNLKLTYTLWGFLIAAYSFETWMSTVQTIGYFFGLALLIVWPMFIMIYLQKN